MIRFAAVAVLAGFLTIFSTSTALAQQAAPEIKRSVLEKVDLSVPGREGVLVRVELAPGAKETKHTHPGDLLGYVQEGSSTLYLEGQPAVHLNAGDAFFIPAGRVHAAANEGTAPLKMLVTFVVEKGKPITSPVQ